MEYFKIFFALSVAFIVAAVLLLNNKLKRITFKEPNGSVESKTPAELLPEKGQNGDVELKNEGDKKGTNFNLVANVPISSPEDEKLLQKGRILKDSLRATTSNSYPARMSNGTERHSSQSKNVVYGAAAGIGTTTITNSVHHVGNIATGLSHSKGNNEVTGIGGIGDTIMMGSFKGIKTIDISGGGSPSLDGGVPKNVVNGIGGIGSTKIKDSFENIESLKISRR
ncbi:hypothetical protein L1049_021034 [Liquidambar formosana]|uniref:Uncharacterized protein n=1 Tax=Liquidambar formosana TaxID=63359 RepID=A0AAP0XB41_LIQFO